MQSGFPPRVRCVQVGAFWHLTVYIMQNNVGRIDKKATVVLISPPAKSLGFRNEALHKYLAGSSGVWDAMHIERRTFITRISC